MHRVFVQRKPAPKGDAPGAGILQRRGKGQKQPATASPIVHDVLRSPGHPLDTATRAFMEPRFGHDFGKVRVHTDARAVESARAASALAYTVGNHVAFGAGRFAPGSPQGRKLLAHELTHTIQQANAGSRPVSSPKPAEHEAERHSAAVVAGLEVRVSGQAQSGVMQKADDNPLDEKAKKIIEAAKDPAKTIDQRAIDAVKDILKTYFDPTMVDTVVYVEEVPGLKTGYTGNGKDLKGQIEVGRYFIEHIDGFSRRVLQVGHELQHVQQQRGGMGGQAKKNEREFRAFHWESTQPEVAGTGKMPHATRVKLIDEALRNFYCMPDDDRKALADKKDELLKLRATEETASGQPHTDPPKECAVKK